MKFMIVVLLAVVLAANAKVITLVDMLKAYEQTNEIGVSAPVVKHVLHTPKSLKACDSTTCVSDCQDVGFAYGNCENGRCICTN